MATVISKSSRFVILEPQADKGYRDFTVYDRKDRVTVGRFKTKEQALASIPGGDFAKPDEPTRRAGSRQSLRSHVAGSTGNFNERPYPKAEPKSLATMTIEEFLDWLAPIEHQWNLEAGTVSGYGR